MTAYSTAELAHWQDQAALLDPAAYQFASGLAAAQTVPADSPWYALNMWFVPTSDTVGSLFTRQATVDCAVLLSAGTTLPRIDAASGHTGGHGLDGFYYVCKPEKVAVQKTLTVTLVAGSRSVTATSGTFDTTHDALRPVAGNNVPAGATIDTVTSTTVASLSRPATASGSTTLTVGDPRYLEDPKALYYTRRQHLRMAQMRDVHCEIAAAAAVGTTATARFPAYAQHPAGMLLAASLSNGSWLILTGPAGNMNLLDEISDDHEWRSGRGVLLPFRTRDFTGIQMKYGSVSGNGVDTQYLGAQGAATYVPLPSGF